MSRNWRQKRKNSKKLLEFESLKFIFQVIELRGSFDNLEGNTLG